MKKIVGIIVAVAIITVVSVSAGSHTAHPEPPVGINVAGDPPIGIIRG